MRPALALLLSLAFAALVIIGCRAPGRPVSTRLIMPAAATCEADLRDQPCVACLKARCCVQAQASVNGYLCAADCAKNDNTKACAARCPTPQERALAECMASSCECPGGP